MYLATQGWLHRAGGGCLALALGAPESRFGHRSAPRGREVAVGKRRDERLQFVVVPRVRGQRRAGVAGGHRGEAERVDAPKGRPEHEALSSCQLLVLQPDLRVQVPPVHRSRIAGVVERRLRRRAFGKTY